MKKPSDLLPGYAWAVHRAYEKQMARTEMQVGAVVYSSFDAWVRGTLKPGEQLVQVKDSSGRGRDAVLRIILCTDSWACYEPMDVTTGRLIDFFVSGDDADLRGS